MSTSRIQANRNEAALVGQASLMVDCLKVDECAELLIHPERALGCGSANADEDIAILDSVLDTLSKHLPSIHALSIKPVIYAPGIERREEREAAAVIVMGMACKYFAIAGHTHPIAYPYSRRVTTA